jgi:sodium/potassium-transporting ATPase subunit alpha
MAFWYLERKGIPFSSVWLLYSQPKTDDAAAHLAEASSIYFINLVVMQWFNLLAVRTRRLSIFQHPPLFNENTQNWYLFPAMGFALCMAIFWLYIPQLQNALGTSQVPAEHFFLPAAFGLGILVLDELRKYCVRRWPDSILSKASW